MKRLLDVSVFLQLDAAPQLGVIRDSTVDDATGETD